MQHYLVTWSSATLTLTIYASVNSICAQCPSPPPPPGYCWAFARLVSPRILANFALPWSRAFANPGTTPALSFWHASEVVSYPNITAKRIVKACSQFYTCISSLLVKPVKLGAIDVNHCFLWSLNQIPVDTIWRTSFHIYKTIQNR